MTDKKPKIERHSEYFSHSTIVTPNMTTLNVDTRKTSFGAEHNEKMKVAESQLFKTMTQIARPSIKRTDSRNTSIGKIKNVHTSIASSTNTRIHTIADEPKQVI